MMQVKKQLTLQLLMLLLLHPQRLRQKEMMRVTMKLTVRWVLHVQLSTVTATCICIHANESPAAAARLSLQCYAVPCWAMLCHAEPCCGMLLHAVPSCAMLRIFLGR